MGSRKRAAGLSDCHGSLPHGPFRRLSLKIILKTAALTLTLTLLVRLRNKKIKD